MRKISLIVLAVVLAACSSPESPQTVANQAQTLQCAKDTDCKGDRICDAGACKSPAKLSPVGASENSVVAPASQTPNKPASRSGYQEDPTIAESHALAIDHLIGTYSSVTESECNSEIKLKKGGEAHTKLRCLLEDGSGEEVSSESKAAWSFSDGVVMIHGSGKQMPFKYYEQLPYADFGAGGAGPGLTPFGPDLESMLLPNHGSLWKTPMQTE